MKSFFTSDETLCDVRVEDSLIYFPVIGEPKYLSGPDWSGTNETYQIQTLGFYGEIMELDEDAIHCEVSCGHRFPKWTSTKGTGVITGLAQYTSHRCFTVAIVLHMHGFTGLTDGSVTFSTAPHQHLAFHYSVELHEIYHNVLHSQLYNRDTTSLVPFHLDGLHFSPKIELMDIELNKCIPLFSNT